MAASQPTGFCVQSSGLSVLPMLFTYLGEAFWKKATHMLLFCSFKTKSGKHVVEAVKVDREHVQVWAPQQQTSLHQKPCSLWDVFVKSSYLCMYYETTWEAMNFKKMKKWKKKKNLRVNALFWMFPNWPLLTHWPTCVLTGTYLQQANIGRTTLV